MGNKSLIHAILYYTASGFFGQAMQGYILCFVIPFRPEVGSVCFGAAS